MVGVSGSKSGLSSAHTVALFFFFFFFRSTRLRQDYRCKVSLLTSAAVALPVQLVDGRGHVTVADAVAPFADGRVAGRRGARLWRRENNNGSAQGAESVIVRRAAVYRLARRLGTWRWPGARRGCWRLSLGRRGWHAAWAGRRPNPRRS